MEDLKTEVKLIHEILTKISNRLQNVEERVDMVDQRVMNVDSRVSAVAERVDNMDNRFEIIDSRLSRNEKILKKVLSPLSKPSPSLERAVIESEGWKDSFETGGRPLRESQMGSINVRFQDEHVDMIELIELGSPRRMEAIEDLSSRENSSKSNMIIIGNDYI